MRRKRRRMSSVKIPNQNLLTEGGTDGVAISVGLDAELPMFQSMC
jgi:hypothetical protein